MSDQWRVSAFAWGTVLDKGATDTHVHLVALPDGKNGCLLSDAMRHSLIFRIVAWQHGLSLDDPQKANTLYLAQLIRNLRESRYVHHAVLLAIDGVYDQKGQLDKTRTEFLISNDLVLSLAKSNIPTCSARAWSINPQRKDAIFRGTEALR